MVTACRSVLIENRQILFEKNFICKLRLNFRRRICMKTDRSSTMKRKSIEHSLRVKAFIRSIRSHSIYWNFRFKGNMHAFRITNARFVVLCPCKGPLLVTAKSHFLYKSPETRHGTPAYCENDKKKLTGTRHIQSTAAGMQTAFLRPASSQFAYRFGSGRNRKAVSRS